MRRIISKIRPDIVHTHGAPYARAAAKSLKITAINTRHCDTKMKTLLYNKITDFTVATSQNMLFGMQKIPQDKRVFIPNGATSAKAINANERLQLRQSLGIADGAFVVGFVGRLEKIKGADIFLSGCAALEKIYAECRFVIVGDGSERAKLEALAKALGIGEKTVFCGYRPDPARYMSIFSVGVNSSLGSETCPLALSEMMSLSLPIVASNIAGNSYMLSGGEGLLFENGNPDSLCRALLRVLCDEQKREKIKKAAYSRYESEFSAEKMAKKYEKLYFDLSKRN